MLEPTEQDVVDKGWPVLWIIWAGMFGSLFVYAVLCYFLAGMPFIPMSDAPVEMIRYIFIFLSAGAMVLAYFVRKTMLSGRFTNPSAQSGFLGQYMTAVIVSEAISEAIAIFGLILLFLGAGLLTAYAFIAVSALNQFIFRPDRDELEQFVDRIKQGSIAVE
jgi:hypothetical protein